MAEAEGLPVGFLSVDTLAPHVQKLYLNHKLADNPASAPLLLSLYPNLTKPFPLAVQAAAVLLPVEAKLPAYLMTFLKARPKIFIKKAYPLFGSHLLTYLPQKLLVLVGANEQGGTEGGKTPELGCQGCH